MKNKHFAPLKSILHPPQPSNIKLKIKTDVELVTKRFFTRIYFWRNPLLRPDSKPPKKTKDGSWNT